jgi:hypothetical protein
MLVHRAGNGSRRPFPADDMWSGWSVGPVGCSSVRVILFLRPHCCTNACRRCAALPRQRWLHGCWDNQTVRTFATTCRPPLVASHRGRTCPHQMVGLAKLLRSGFCCKRRMKAVALKLVVVGARRLSTARLAEGMRRYSAYC